MTRDISEEEFTAAIRAAVAERGADWIYPFMDPNYVYVPSPNAGCRYSNRDGKPACIIGAALAKIDPALVPSFERITPAVRLLQEILGVVHEYLPNWVWAAQRAQHYQDSGSPWGEALKAYETELRS